MRDDEMYRRTFIKGAGGAVLAVSTIGVPGIVKSALKMDEVPISVIYPMTGPAGAFGQNAVRGWNIAVEEINADGGIKSLGGAKIRTVLQDTASNVRIGMAEVEKAAQNKTIPMMVGCWQSAVTYPASQVAEQNGFPMLIDMATQPDILRRGFKYVFRVVLPADGMALRLVQFVEDIGKRTGHVAKRVALLSLDENFGQSSAEAFRQALKNTKQEIVQDIFIPVKTTNVDVEVAKLKAAKPDVIYLTNYLTDAILISRALHAQKVDALAYVTFAAGYADPEYIKIVGDLGNYFYAIAKFDADLNRPMEKEFEAKMKKTYGVSVNHHSAALYSVAYTIKDVLERAQTVDRAKVRDAIAATNITTGRALMMPSKYIRFDERGENRGAEDLVVQCISKEWHTVWPLDWPRKFDPVWPMPKWDSRKL